VCLRLEAREGEEALYESFFQYLNTRDRFAVVGNSNKKTVKDCYVFPLAAGKPVPADLLPLEGPGLPTHRGDTLLCLIVRTKRKRAADIPPHPALPAKQLKRSPFAPYSPDQVATPVQAALPTSSVKTPAVVSTKVYNPLVADLDEPYDPGEDDEPYDPGEYPSGGGYLSGGVQKLDSSQSQGDDSPGPAQPVKSSDSGGFTDQLRKLQEEVDFKKAVLARRVAQAQRDHEGGAQHFGSPPPHFNQPGGGPPPHFNQPGGSPPPHFNQPGGPPPHFNQTGGGPPPFHTDGGHQPIGQYSGHPAQQGQLSDIGFSRHEGYPAHRGHPTHQGHPTQQGQPTHQGHPTQRGQPNHHRYPSQRDRGYYHGNPAF